ncbi:MAG: hypothetical protein ACOCUS_07230, partial [Polyangiales bacterium]
PYDPPPADARGLERLDDVVRIDTVGLAANVAEQALTTLRAVGWPGRAEHVDFVVVPSRTELASVAPGLVLVSDRLFEVFPLELTRAFHDRALRRAIFRSVVADETAAREPPADRPWAADLRAALLNDLDAARREHDVTTTQDLIGWAGFHPAVDQLLYAPQIAFVDVFFGTVDEPDPWRADPARSRRPRASGRRILEMARSALGEERFEPFARGLLAEGPVSAREALARAAPDMVGRLPVWLAAPGLEVNYRLGEIDSRRLPDGGFRHRIEVVREGAERPEPVVVEVEDEDGDVERVTWKGVEQRGVVEVETAAALDDVRLDPERRLVQSPSLTSGHPRHDDATQHPWKPPILRAFGLSVLASEGTVDAFIDFAMRRKYDLDNTIAFQLGNDSRSAGVGARYIRGVGPKRHNNARIGSVSTGVDVDRLRPGFTEDGEGGVRLSARLGAGVTTHTFFADPRNGQSLSGSVRASLVRRDDETLSWSVGTGLRGNVTFPLGLRNVVLLVAGASWIFGDPVPGERPGLGGQFLLRGYESDELVGDGIVYGVAEHRWTALNDLALNALHLAWIREIQIALFAGGGLGVEPVRIDDALEPAAEVGAGLRVHFEYAGVQPGVLAIDVGLPLLRTEQARETRAPIGVHIGFDQFF